MQTIVAQSTSPGKSGIGILRISGKKTIEVAQLILKCLPSPRVATYSNFFDVKGNILDTGIAILFPKPNSFTGEDVLELQGHGNDLIIDLLIKNILTIKHIRLAKPGEFTQRAVLNNKIDLTQAEGIADLINAESVSSIQLSLKIMQGDFSKHIKNVIKNISDINVLLETELNFSEEEGLMLNLNVIENTLNTTLKFLLKIKNSDKEGIILKEGAKIVICGPPNSGKSTILNMLSKDNTSIVTNIAGTTRDLIHQKIQIKGLSFIVTDTAGLRKSDNIIEKIGIKKTKKMIHLADHVLFVIDLKKYKINKEYYKKIENELLQDKSYCIIFNKIDLLSLTPIIKKNKNTTHIYISAKNNIGLKLLTNYLFHKYKKNNSKESIFTTRRRHLIIINQVFIELSQSLTNWKKNHNLELLSESLRIAINLLQEIIHCDSSETVLKKIFSEFCIGK
ncbi:tRNA uridine-5-carboxymethylaminomethyl(34) synthesis GTPase MnmE [Buchnera aphidicola]|uniref:tRNA uridine-5-carboxymethylaminomethyl(34) synthesis GTPase MnmE n=1 Tax=Buchnera aphidicola TaxID=9 RepID=UPI0034649F0C